MNTLTVPPALKSGDKVALISTARKIDPDHLEGAVNQLKKWGLEAIEGESLRAEQNQFCGSDLQRAADLQWAINDPEIKAIICFRGGYGTVRILDKVDFTPLSIQPKWICGYSDVTALHNKLHGVCGLQSLHSTMPVNFGTNTPEALDSFKKALFGESYSIEIMGDQRNRIGNAEGQLVGGNLSMLYSLSGTKYDLDTTDKILFIEDLDEYLYHIDRIMWNLKLSGKLENLAGLVVGGMTDMHDNDTPFGKDAVEIILDAVKDYHFPVCFNFPCGHIDDNRTLILGKKVRLDVGFTVEICF